MAKFVSKWLSLLCSVSSLGFFSPASPTRLPIVPQRPLQYRDVLSHKPLNAGSTLAPRTAEAPSQVGVNMTSPLTSPSSQASDSEDLSGTEVYVVTLAPDVNLLQYVKNLKTHFEQGTDSDLSSAQSKIRHVYGSIMHGFSAHLSPRLYDRVSRDPAVTDILIDKLVPMLPESGYTLIEPDTFGGNTASSQSTDISGDPDGSDAKVVVQKGTAPWNLQRISQRAMISTNGNTTASAVYDYTYLEPAGKGTYVYVLDTGARATHAEFEGRVEATMKFGDYGLADNNGHGTHCSGLVTSSRWGVAKRAKVRALKVLGDDGRGRAADIIAGLQYVVDQYRITGYPPTVASMSLACPKSATLDYAVQSAIDQGIHVVASAGNFNDDACDISPSSNLDAIVVAASDIKDRRASFSNWGKCVDFFAPGADISSTWHTSDDAIHRAWGTSSAAPQVAGLIAYHLSVKNITTKEMYRLLKRNSIDNAIDLNDAPEKANPSTTRRFVFNGVR